MASRTIQLNRHYIFIVFFVFSFNIETITKKSKRAALFLFEQIKTKSNRLPHLSILNDINCAAYVARVVESIVSSELEKYMKKDLINPKISIKKYQVKQESKKIYNKHCNGDEFFFDKECNESRKTMNNKSKNQLQQPLVIDSNNNDNIVDGMLQVLISSSIPPKHQVATNSKRPFTDKEKQQLANEVQKATEEKEKEINDPSRSDGKKKVELTSSAVGKIHIGTCVTVEEIQGRRARISEPLVGCLSVHTDGEKSRIILQKEGTKSPEMEAALQAERGRQTKVLILKSITTLSDATVERLLEKSDWNLRNAIDAFYTAKYKTLEYVMKAQQQSQQMVSSTETEKANSSSTLTIPKENKPSTANPTGRRQSKLLFWKSWKKFTVENGGQ
ncbi:hypothetical protein RFI_27505 [Reticulomyxa filosa]|uniref:Uncharacterized protein n=1 Tax=Reticulomyxa filosa TaxID=46433 RepID=X6M7D6_RETFI|nr:hypothetical protein RFI_27505 [Reticulomyxa filosa]|eukprot:ETO09873.1 hypothetical protein RFI_27505 [Reticulomyxa filosa]